MGSFERIMRNVQGNIAPALLENIDRPYTPPRVERHGALEATPPELLEKLFPAHSLEKLMEQISPMENGRYRARDIAGDPKIGTRHVHDFVIDKSDLDTKLFVVDPEHALGGNKNRSPLGLPRRGDLRPKVCVLYGARIQNASDIPDVSIIRYRSNALLDPHLLKPDQQLAMNEEMLCTGAIPKVLIGKEKKITFRFDMREGATVASSQLSSIADLENLLEGKTSSAMAEGQLRRFLIFMNYFSRHLRGEKAGTEFKLLTNDS